MPSTEPAHGFAGLDAARLPSPCFVIDVARLERNLRTLADIGEVAGVKMLLALKAFACFAVADLIGAHLDGAAASGLWEARLARTRFGGEVHSFAPGLKARDLAEIEALSDHLVFNTPGQWQRYAPGLRGDGRCRYGIRLNPRHSEVETPLYDPCAPGSRLGVPAEVLGEMPRSGLSGALVHALCDQGFDPFDRLLTATEDAFGWLLAEIDWINLGGGQLLTAPDYPVERLVRRLSDFRSRTGLEVYLEPGTAVALEAGALVAEVVDTGWNEGYFAVLDGSATCHMPDVIEAPYTPEVLGAEIVEAKGETDPRDAHVVTLGGPTCLAGDVVGTYRFARPPAVGERLIVLDQAYYTMVKTTTFNGTPLPAIALWDPGSDDIRIVRSFDYETFESRLS